VLKDDHVIGHKTGFGAILGAGPDVLTAITLLENPESHGL
jgi:hypothetical protein